MTPRGLASFAPLAAWAALAAALCSWDGALERPAVSVMAAPTREVEALCSRTGYPAADFWDRLKALGVSVAILPEERLSDLAADGRVLGFTRAEWEKWSAMGLVAPGARMRPGAVWMRDRAVHLRVAAAARSAGVSFSTSAAGGLLFLEFPDGFDWPALPAGLGPDAAKALSGAGLIPVLDDGDGSAVVAGLRMKRVELAVGSSPRRVLRAAESGPDRLFVWRLELERGVEGNIAALRDSVRLLRGRGWSFGGADDGSRSGRTDPVSGLGEGRPDASWEWPAKAVFGLIVLVGPLLAARSSLAWLKGTRAVVRRKAPLGSPVLEFLAGMSGAWFMAALAGVAARLAAHYAGAPLSASWRVWAVAGPLALGAMSLFPPPWRGLARMSEVPLTPLSLFKVSLFAAAAYLCVDAGADLAGAALERAGDAVLGNAEAMWWLPRRWREFLMGWPCLLAALDLVHKGWPGPAAADGTAAADPPVLDPRPWLLAGLLGPAGMILSFSNHGVPMASVLAQSLGALCAGSVVGAFVVWVLVFNFYISAT